jgi:hypothetical protein
MKRADGLLKKADELRRQHLQAASLTPERKASQIAP